MMAVIFAIVSAGLIITWFGRRPVAIVLITIALLLSVHLFLWEVYSPDYGYRMPWIQT